MGIRTPVFTSGLNNIGCLTYHLLSYTLACVSPGMLQLPYKCQRQYCILDKFATMDTVTPAALATTGS